MSRYGKNIAAISTAPGTGGVAVIRISGESPLAVAEKMFRPIGKTPVKDFEPYRMYPGEIDGGDFTDFGMCVFFRGPKSFTGEDVVEFHCHGGVAITRGVLQRALSLGARMATNGEFTKRAFLNGKMSLSSCEGLIDMINSESVGGVRAGYYLYREKLNDAVREMQAKLTYVLAFVNADIDYPDEGVGEDHSVEIRQALAEVISSVDGLLSRYGKGRSIKCGVRVALLGKPNTGKSSVLNRLLDYDKAIVSSVAGTTRDLVEGEIEIDGVRYLLTDTAGIRKSGDELESSGILRSVRVMKESDVCVVVLDGSSPLGEDDFRVLRETEGSVRLIVVNKSDLGVRTSVAGDVTVSARTGEGFDEFRTLLAEKAFGGKIDYNADFLTEERHREALVRAKVAAEDALKGLSATPDLVTIDIKEAWEALGEISGESANEKIIDEIFSKFCVGK
ncbi:MAG: tRNA uridine-5-carboxymethylaminomethyl(34) synthesis GTPase MnmE [Candidatus Borkfalkiaceae bacterium]|nr:tRNA uridine-5-carboxymethylaminomethyl(34) synthesis GTPase MnmE [Christensenellaceae bacterium]